MMENGNGKMHRFPGVNRLTEANKIPMEQVKKFTCDCGETFFRTVHGVVIGIDRLDNKKHFPSPQVIYECAACGGIVKKVEDGSLVVVHAKTRDGE